MNTDNITKGKFNYVKSSIDVWGLKVNEVSNEKEWVAYVRGESIYQIKPNSELICEAFNVANETGLSPIQMKERIAELEEENVIIPIWQFKEIEDALRLTYTINKCQSKVTAFDRLVCKAWNFAKIALNPKTDG